MTESRPTAPGRIAPAGLMFLAVTSVCWGVNWPVMKYQLSELPPLTLRGGTGMVGAVFLALLALASSQSLRVRRDLWPRLILSAVLNVTAWMVLIGLSLLWLPASEAVLLAFTMPVWASLVAWPVLGERPTVLRVAALALAFAGLATIMGHNGIAATTEKWPGIALALCGAVGFALGTVTAKKLPIAMPPIASAAWQVGIGCLPVFLSGLVFETASFERVTTLGYWLLFYSVTVQFGLAYLTWFAALARLPASVAAIGTMSVPVIGVVASAITLGEPLGLIQVVALVFTLAGVVLATRS